MVEDCVGTAGFSVGEYASLVFAGAIEFEDGNCFSIIKNEIFDLLFGISMYCSY